MSRLRREIPDLREALTGRFDDHYGLIVGQLLTRLSLVTWLVPEISL